MVFLVPFFVLLKVLLVTKNRMMSLIIALICSFFVNCFLANVSPVYFFINTLPDMFLSVMSPSGYLYPLLFLLLVAIIINIFKDLFILDSYSHLFNSFLNRSNKKIIDISIILAPFIFFIDDYLVMFGVKSFFSPLVENSDQNKNEIAFYTLNIASASSVLFFFSTWSGIIINQIEVVKNVIPAWSGIPGVEIFLQAKKYFFYPICTYLMVVFYIYTKKKNFLVLYKKSSNKKIIWSDIFIFLLLPLSIAINFIYTLYIQSVALLDIDVSFLMLQGAGYGFLVIIFLLIIYKSITLKYLFNSIINTLLEYSNTVISLLACWLLSKITLLSFQIDFNFIFPEHLIFLAPLLYFLLSFLVALVLGSEWGTLSIIIPLIVCVKNYHNLFLVLGAIISGVLAGAQLSPVSNTVTTVGAIFEVDSLKSYLYRLKSSVIIMFCIALAYFLIGFFY